MSGMIKLTGCDIEDGMRLSDYSVAYSAETVLCAIGHHVLFEVNSEAFRRQVEAQYRPFCESNGFEMVEITSLGQNHLRAVIKHIHSGDNFTMDVGDPDN